MWSGKDSPCSPRNSRHAPQFCCIPKRKPLIWNSSKDPSEAYDYTSGLVTCRRFALQKTGNLDHTSVKTLYAQPLSNYSCNFGDLPRPFGKPLVTVRNHVITSAHNAPKESIAVLQQQNSRYSTWQTYASLRKPTVLLPHSRVQTTTSADQHWHHLRPDTRNTMIYAHTTSRTVPTCHISLGSLKLPAPEAGVFVKLILLYKNVFTHNKEIMAGIAVSVWQLPASVIWRRNIFSKCGISMDDYKQLTSAILQSLLASFAMTWLYLFKMNRRFPFSFVQWKIWLGTLIWFVFIDCGFPAHYIQHVTHNANRCHGRRLSPTHPPCDQLHAANSCTVANNIHWGASCPTCL